MADIDSLSPAEKKALTAFRKDVRRICGKTVIRMVLFGSRARHEGNEESDVDVLVLLSGPDNRLKVKIWDAAYVIFDKTGIYLSPLVLSMDQFNHLKARERLIAQEIERDGIAL